LTCVTLIALVTFVAFIARLESEDGPLGGRSNTGEKLVTALQKAGIEFIAEDGGGAGVRLKKRRR
jgi:hypothetical protein